MSIESPAEIRPIAVAPQSVRIATERAMRFRVEVDGAQALDSPAERGRAHPLALLDLEALRKSIAEGHPGAKLD